MTYFIAPPYIRMGLSDGSLKKSSSPAGQVQNTSKHFLLMTADTFAYHLHVAHNNIVLVFLGAINWH